MSRTDVDEVKEIARTSGKKSTIAILQVLERYSGKGHRLQQEQICRKVLEDYGLEIDRKTVSRTIEMLQDFRFRNRKKVFDIKCEPRLGAYLCGSNSEAKIIIRSAIMKGKQVSFVHYIRDVDGKEVPNNKEDHVNGQFIVDPYEIVNSMGHEYLICHKVGDGPTLRNIRIDRMRYVEEIEKSNRKPLKEIKDYTSGRAIDKEEYAKKMQYHMFGGDIGLVQFRIDKGPQEVMERIVNILWNELENFSNLEMHMMKDGWIKVSVDMPKKGARAFAFQFADQCTVIYPYDLVRDLRESFKRIGSSYENVVIND